tara:strand:- start:339 stop:578 length:240 start_codon:yes stop_codon:yes gene_type:complete
MEIINIKTNESAMEKYKNNCLEDLKFELCELKSNPLYKQKFVDYFKEFLEDQDLKQFYSFDQTKICFIAALIDVEINDK